MHKNDLQELNQLFDNSLNSYELKTTFLLSKISGALVKYRLDHQMTQKEFAKKLGISQAMVSKIESEEYNFTIGKLVEICDKLGLSFNVEIEQFPIHYKQGVQIPLTVQEENK